MGDDKVFSGVMQRHLSFDHFVGARRCRALDVCKLSCGASKWGKAAPCPYGKIISWLPILSAAPPPQASAGRNPFLRSFLRRFRGDVGREPNGRL